MRILASTNARAMARILDRDSTRDPRVTRTAARIVSDVRRRGDRAVLDWTRRFDDPAATAAFEVSRADVRAGWAATPRSVRQAIRFALRHIERVADRQLPRPFIVRVTPGVRIEQRVDPLDRVGCYVPGGRYPLPSTVLMTVGPARVAGVPDITVACPRPAPAVLCAALEAGATRVLRIGGAQAIAALAYGTRSIGAVDKIVGPGNAFVAAAKTLVSADCAIDFQAGPSEIVICADRGRPDWIAADLIAQAEHDPSARAILITTSQRLARRVALEVRRQLPTAGPAAAAIRRQGAVIVTRSRDESAALVSRIAPEHLVCDTARDARRLRHAGTTFVGCWSAQASGDYATGSNHVLPTGGAARSRGGLGAADFVRVSTVQTLTRSGIRRIGPAAIALAEAEGLHSHASSIRIRL